MGPMVMSTICDVLLGFGANLGNRRETLLAAWRELGELPEIEKVRISRLIETQAFGGPTNQPQYLNAVGLIRTTLTPQRLLDVLHDIERRFGRVRTERWEPRTLDLDILLFGDLIIKTETLTIPHPEMLRRDFVMEPAVGIAPDFVHPEIGLTLRSWSVRHYPSESEGGNKSY